MKAGAILLQSKKGKKLCYAMICIIVWSSVGMPSVSITAIAGHVSRN